MPTRLLKSFVQNIFLYMTAMESVGFECCLLMKNSEPLHFTLLPFQSHTRNMNSIRSISYIPCFVMRILRYTKTIFPNANPRVFHFNSLLQCPLILIWSLCSLNRFTVVHMFLYFSGLFSKLLICIVAGKYFPHYTHNQASLGVDSILHSC